MVHTQPTSEVSVHARWYSYYSILASPYIGYMVEPLLKDTWNEDASLKVSFTQALKNNCTHLGCAHVSTFVNGWNMKKSTTPSFMFVVSVFKGHVLRQTDSPIVYDRTTTWAVPRKAFFFFKHKVINLSGKVLCSRVTIDKSHCSCFLFAYLSLRSKKENFSHQLIVGLTMKTDATTPKICPYLQTEGSYVLLSFMYWKHYWKAINCV